MPSRVNHADKVALITGAGRGIGPGIALALAKRGAKIAAAGRTLDKCEHTCRLIADATEQKPLPSPAMSPTPLISSAQWPATVARFGALDILVNNAVSTSPGPLLTQKHEQIMTAFTVGPIATLRLMQLPAIPTLQRQRRFHHQYGQHRGQTLGHE